MCVSEPARNMTCKREDQNHHCKESTCVIIFFNWLLLRHFENEVAGLGLLLLWCAPHVARVLWTPRAPVGTRVEYSRAESCTLWHMYWIRVAELCFSYTFAICMRSISSYSRCIFFVPGERSRGRRIPAHVVGVA